MNDTKDSTKTKQLLRDKVWFPGTLLNFYSNKPPGTTSNDRNTTNTMVQDIYWFLWSISNKKVLVRASSWVTTITDTHLLRYKDIYLSKVCDTSDGQSALSIWSTGRTKDRQRPINLKSWVPKFLQLTWLQRQEEYTMLAKSQRRGWKIHAQSWKSYQKSSSRMHKKNQLETGDVLHF